MRKDTLVRLVEKYHLPISSPEKMLVGHLRHQFEIHFPTYLEDNLLRRIKADILPLFDGLLCPGRNRCHFPSSRLELDFSWTSLRIGIEVQGGLKNGKSGHRSESGVRRDINKQNLAILHQWELIHLTDEHIMTDHTWKAYTLPLITTLIRRKRSDA